MKTMMLFGWLLLPSASMAGGGHMFPGVIGPAGGGTGVSTQTTTGAVIFGGANGVYTSNPANFFWDNTNNRLGLGTNSPQTSFHALGTTTSRAILVNSPDPVFAATAGNTSTEIAIFGTAYSASNASMLDFLAFSTSSVNPLFRITNHWEGTSSSGTISIGNNVGTTYTNVLAITTQTRVGVGTINPLSTFDVVGSAALGTYGGANAAPSNGLIVSGTVGIGTAIPNTKLHMSSGVVTVDGTSPGVFIYTPAGTNGLQVRNTSASQIAIMGVDANGAGIFSLTNSAGSIMVTADGQSGGTFGVGTANPATKIHMSSGTLTLDGNTQLVINAGGTIRTWSRTMVQIDTLVPGAVGEQIFCSNCTTPDICVSTGTSAAQFRRIGTTSGCGSGN